MGRKTSIAIVILLITLFYTSGFLLLRNYREFIPSVVEETKESSESSESTSSVKGVTAEPFYKVTRVID